MSIEIEAVVREGMFWSPTGKLRWFRPAHGTDAEIRLEQLWERVTGEAQWRPVPTVLAD